MVASRYVVTAAHCVQQINSSDIFVRVGEHDLHVVGETNVERRINVSEIITHEHYDYNSSSYDNDIAVVYLSEHLDLSLYTPACLAKSDDNPTSLVGKMATIAGWGLVGEDIWPDPFVPSEVAVPVMEATDCAGDPVNVASILDKIGRAHV